MAVDGGKAAGMVAGHGCPMCGDCAMFGRCTPPWLPVGAAEAACISFAPARGWLTDSERQYIPESKTRRP